MTPSKITNVATKILLDDANKGFKNGNFVCSPFSLEILLGMLAAGAEGETLKQLLGFLGCETVDQVFYESKSSKLCKILSSLNGGADVTVANGAWVAKTVSPFQSRYEEILETVYETKAGLLDFKNKPAEAVGEINSWCNEKTKGLIPTIVSNIDRDTKIILANALYFKGSWFRPFTFTKNKDFHLINGDKKTVSVPFMTCSSEIGYRLFEDGFSYGSFEDYKILKIPYEGGHRPNKLFSMYIFLPHKKDGLQDLLQMFHSDPDLLRTKFDLTLQKLDELWIPKFNISCSFEAQDVMKQMGLAKPFEAMNNELTRIIECRRPDEDLLYVTKILQKCFIEIDEKGTKAAACSVAMMRYGGFIRKTPSAFVADHPFMFMIREDYSQSVFFVGVVLNPLEKSEHIQNQSLDSPIAEKYEHMHNRSQFSPIAEKYDHIQNRSIWPPMDENYEHFRNRSTYSPMAGNYEHFHNRSPYSPMAENYEHFHNRSPYSPMAENYRHFHNRSPYSPMAENYEHFHSRSPYSPMAENYQHFHNRSPYPPMAESYQHFHNRSPYPPMAESNQHFHNRSPYSPMAENYQHFHNRSPYSPMAENYQHFHNRFLYSPMAENYEPIHNHSLYSPMAEKSKHIHDQLLYSPMDIDEEHEQIHKKQKKLTPTTKLTTVATKILLDDANEGFKNGNFVCSPFSLEILLGMLAAGAVGKTLKQLLEFLEQETVEQLLYESPSLKLCKILSSSNGGVDVSVANGAWVAKTVSPIQSRYAEILKTVYETKAGFLDFENKPDEAAEEINSWVNKKTKGLIPTIVEKSDLCDQDREIKIIFANALHFKGSWFRPFDFTTKKEFHLINGEKTVSVPFMTSSMTSPSQIGYFENGFSYGSFEDYKILKIPYESDRQRNKLFSMYIFLPHKIDGLQDLLQIFHSDPDLFRSKFDLTLQKLDELWIPKFKISYTFEAQDVMKQMGLTLPFYSGNNEFTRIIECRQLDEDLLYVTKILQKSFIEIDEEGTKAAACSLAMMAFGGSPPENPPSFVADHPFMFMIREDISQAVFFVGVVLNPLE